MLSARTCCQPLRTSSRGGTGELEEKDLVDEVEGQRKRVAPHKQSSKSPPPTRHIFSARQLLDTSFLARPKVLWGCK